MVQGALDKILCARVGKGEKMKIELLAPAGDMQCLESAINNGADAVYLGIQDFNARKNAENFTKETLPQAIKRCHLFGVKVYLALNVLVKDEEFESVTDIVYWALKHEIDAIIVQDIGLASIIKQKFPNANLHASTQMGISTLEGAIFLKELGFSRIVLARETQIEEIKRIRDNIDIEIEYFIHGALCVGYSGNCYFSSLVEGESGNRGRCKQLCRLPLTVEKGNVKKQGFLLSTKDLCLVEKLKELVDAGVTSLKIEGRARRSAYVGGIVKEYRTILNQYYQYSDSNIIKMKKLFNRGEFACGYLKGENMIYPKINSHIGVEIGMVEKFKKGNRFNEITILSKHEICKGDVLQFEKDGRFYSLSVYDFKNASKNLYTLTSTNVVPVGARVNLLVDKRQEEEIFQEKRVISVDAKLVALKGEPVHLRLTSGQVEIEIEGSVCLGAISQALSQDEAFVQVSKMGENYLLGNLEFVSDGVFIRKAELNQLRRDAVEMLESAIVLKNEKDNLQLETINEISLQIKQKEKKNSKNILIFDDLEKIKDNYSEDEIIIFSPAELNSKKLIDFCKNFNGKIYLDCPVFATIADIKIIKTLLNSCDNLGIVANNYYCLTLTCPERIIIGSEMNVYNSYSVEFYRNKGFENIILSKENFGQLILQDKTGLFMNQGVREKLIYMKHCPIKEHFSGDCKNCKYCEGITYSLARKKFNLKRKKIASCLFYLEDQEKGVNASEGFGKVVEIF